MEGWSHEGVGKGGILTGTSSQVAFGDGELQVVVNTQMKWLLGLPGWLQLTKVGVGALRTLAAGRWRRTLDKWGCTPFLSREQLVLPSRRDGACGCRGLCSSISINEEMTTNEIKASGWQYGCRLSARGRRGQSLLGTTPKHSGCWL